MPLNFEFKGKTYPNVVQMSKDMPIMTSTMIGWTDEAEVLMSNAAAICYDTNVKHKVNVDKEMLLKMIEEDNFNNIHQAISYSIGNLGKKIIGHCRDSGHNTVIEHGSATFLKKVPVFTARQDLRARHASFDERSLRYCRADDGGLTYFIPDYMSQSKMISLVKQGKHEEARFVDEMRKEWIEDHERAIHRYSKYADEELNEMWDALGVSGERVRETMRARLPLGINTMYVDTRNLWSWIHHSGKRLCLRAQKEIRVIRLQEVAQLRKVFPNLFGDVNMPCMMAEGCSEKTKCGVIELEETGRWEKKYFERKIQPTLNR